MAANFKIEMFNPKEEEITFDSFIKFPLFCFKLVFFDVEPLKENPSLRERFRFKARAGFTVLTLVAFFFAVISWFLHSFLTAKDFMSASSTVPNMVTGVLVFLKTFVAFAHRKELWNIFASLRKVFATHEAANATYKLRRYLDDYHFVMKLYASIFSVLFWPVIWPTFNFLIFGNMEFTITYWYPFDPYTLQTFPIALIWIDFLDWTFLVYMLSADSLLYALCTVVAMEFDILHIDLMNIRLTPKNDRGKKIKSLVERHNELFDLVDELQNIYGVTFLVSFTVSALVMCFDAFMISLSNDFGTVSFYFPFFLVIAGQIYLMCVYGQKIADSSEGIADGLYSCNWEELNDVAVTKQLILMMTRAQKSKRLNGLGFIDVTLMNFTSVKSSFV